MEQLKLKPRVTGTDHNGYSIISAGRRGFECYDLFTPAGKFLRDYRGRDAAFEAAERHHRNSKVITLRDCMNFDNCGNEFESSGIGHRLCDKCTTKSPGLI